MSVRVLFPLLAHRVTRLVHRAGCPCLRRVPPGRLVPIERVVDGEFFFANCCSGSSTFLPSELRAQGDVERVGAIRSTPVMRQQRARLHAEPAELPAGGVE